MVSVYRVVSLWIVTIIFAFILRLETPFSCIYILRFFLFYKISLLLYSTMSFASASMAASEAPKPNSVLNGVLGEDGEYFEEDPTVGRGVPRDTDGELTWHPMLPVAPSPEFLEVIQRSLDDIAAGEKK